MFCEQWESSPQPTTHFEQAHEITHKNKTSNDSFSIEIDWNSYFSKLKTHNSNSNQSLAYLAKSVHVEISK